MKPGDLVRLSIHQCQNVLWSESILSGVPIGEWTPRDTGIILEIKKKYLQLTERCVCRVIVGSAIGWIDSRDVELV